MGIGLIVDHLTGPLCCSFTLQGSQRSLVSVALGASPMKQGCYSFDNKHLLLFVIARDILCQLKQSKFDVLGSKIQIQLFFVNYFQFLC